jgi:hypothetical protein
MGKIVEDCCHRPIRKSAGWDSFSAWILILRSGGGAAVCLQGIALPAPWSAHGEPCAPDDFSGDDPLVCCTRFAATGSRGAGPGPASRRFRSGLTSPLTSPTTGTCKRLQHNSLCLSCCRVLPRKRVLGDFAQNVISPRAAWGPLGGTA